MKLYSVPFSKLALVAGLGLVILAAHAQTVLWAAKVVDVSSQKATGKAPFSADKVLSAPNALPLGESNNEAWEPGKDGSNESIEVRFARSVKAQQVTVVENFNP